MSIWQARLVSVLLLGVLVGTPAAAAVCAFECATPARGVAGAMASTPVAVGCHEAPVRATGGAEFVRGDRVNCRDHALPESSDAAVLTVTRASAPLVALLAVAVAAPSFDAAPVSAAMGTPSRGPAAPSTAITRPPLVLRI